MRTHKLKVLAPHLRNNWPSPLGCVNRVVSHQTDISCGKWTCLTVRGQSINLRPCFRHFSTARTWPGDAASRSAAETSEDSLNDSDDLDSEENASEAESESSTFATDADAGRYLADIVARDIMSSSLTLKQRKEHRKMLVAIEPGSGILTRRLMERYRSLDVRGTYRQRKDWSESADACSADYPSQYSIVDANFWNVIIGNEAPESTLHLDQVFYGEDEANRREYERMNRSPFKSNKDDNVSSSPADSSSVPSDTSCLLSSSDSSASSDSSTSTVFSSATDSSSSSPKVTSPLYLFSFAKISYCGRLFERLIDAMVEPEASLLGQHVNDSVFYIVLPVSQAPFDFPARRRSLEKLPAVESTTRGGNLVLVTGKRFQGTLNRVQQKTRVSLINTFYEITPLAVVCPYVIAECSAFKSFAKGQQPYLLVRISAKKADEIAVKPERRGSFELFVNVLCSTPDKRVIPSVEDYVPNMGHAMIMEGGFTMSELTKDISLPRLITIFNMMAENPVYGETILGLTESGKMNADEWLKKSLVVKKGFIKAKYTN